MDFNLELNYEGFEKYHVVAGLRYDGTQHIFRFNNDYGASVAKWTGTFGYESDLWELAVIQFGENGDYNLIFDTPIADGVVGHLTDGEVCWYLGKIRDLPKRLVLIADPH